MYEKPKVSTDANSYVAIQLEEVNELSNMLLAISIYKRRLGEVWPREILMHKCSRMSIRIGKYTIIKRASWAMLDVIYLSKYIPVVDICDGRRYPTIFKKKRHPVGKAFRDRFSSFDGKLQ